MSTDQSKPDVHHLLDCLDKCRRKDGSLKTDHYLGAFGELNRLFHCMGKGLGLTMYSLPPAIRALEIHRVKGAGCHYDNFTLMLEYEAENKLLKGSPKLMSGTSALSQLHQSLSFVLAFLKKLTWALETDKPFEVSQRGRMYSETLAHFHPVWVRSSVKVLLLRSPGRQEWMKRLDRYCQGDTQPLQLLKSIVEKATPIYVATTELFRSHALRAT